MLRLSWFYKITKIKSKFDFVNRNHSTRITQRKVEQCVLVYNFKICMKSIWTLNEYVLDKSASKLNLVSFKVFFVRLIRLVPYSSTWTNNSLRIILLLIHHLLEIIPITLNL